jgi:hypothetical protein
MTSLSIFAPSSGNGRDIDQVTTRCPLGERLAKRQELPNATGLIFLPVP